MSIFCAVTKRTFKFSWPDGLVPIDWDDLTRDVEEKTGGVFKARLRGLNPGQFESSLKITSDASGHDIIKQVSEIILNNLDDQSKIDFHDVARFIFHGTVSKDTNWRR